MDAYATWTNIEPVLCHLVDCSARVLKKVVPSRDITPCRRKEPLMRRSPNRTSYHFGGTHLCEEEPAELKHLSRQRKRNQLEIGLVKAIENPIGQTESCSEEL